MIKRDRAKILNLNEASLGPDQKRARVEKFPGLDEAVLSFVRECRDNNCIVTGPSVQAAAQWLSVSILKEMDPHSQPKTLGPPMVG